MYLLLDCSRPPQIIGAEFHLPDNIVLVYIVIEFANTNANILRKVGCIHQNEATFTNARSEVFAQNPTMKVGDPSAEIIFII